MNITRLATLLLLLAMLAPLGCAAVTENVAETVIPLPSNYRDWASDQVLLPEAEFSGEKVVVRNIRNCKYLSKDDFILDYYDKEFDLNKVKSVDFLVVPFKEMPALAHTMISFGFEDDEYLGVSVEVRKEKGEEYDPLDGMFNQFEIMYVVASERDMILRRTKFQNDDVYLYETNATPQQAREMFHDVFARVNKLRESPEFYHTLLNNCTSNIVDHVNKLQPNTVPLDPQSILPGMSDKLAFELGLLKPKGSFEITKRKSWVNERASRYAEVKDFSEQIRR